MSFEWNNLYRPLSAAQLGVWVAQNLDPANPVFNVGQYVRVHGPVDTALFEAALDRVIREADTLRLAFSDASDGPRQMIQPSLDWNLTTLDVSGDPDGKRTAKTWMTADMARPPKLTDSPNGLAWCTPGAAGHRLTC